MLVGAGQTDAITNMAREIRGVLQKLGRSEIFATHVAPNVTDVRGVSAFPSSPGRLLIFHASLGDPETFRFLLTRTEPIVLLFHNLSPASYFELADPHTAAMLRWGWREIELLRPRVVWAAADSHFNAQALRAHGYHDLDIEVIPAGLDVKRLTRVRADPATVRMLDHSVDGHLLVFCGQSLAHKRIEQLVHMQHILTNYSQIRTTLALVGPPTNPSIVDAFMAQAKALSLRGLLTLGQVPDSALSAIYHRADVFVSASDHEGLCVPVLEAMACDVPIIAKSVGAIPETVRNAGMLVSGSAGPLELAEAVIEVCSNRALRTELILRGRERVKDFDVDVTLGQLLHGIAAVA